jgi:hypothetical protein
VVVVVVFGCCGGGLKRVNLTFSYFLRLFGNSLLLFMEAHLDIKNILVRILLFFKVFFKYEIQSYDNLKD